ncbi:uncharacterized protein LOC110095168 isoform X2 [Dendrobium catenatum]|uniref:uncharacterized protein LOC110095168 isoform X2 n=1 Tax=Dendrobium catenatum TaxID=906689 RepID=UPI00109EF1B0|nr:uncharacterized protein LOC110095168 isoform X2 [Dendrobium catenatum]
MESKEIDDIDSEIASTEKPEADSFPGEEILCVENPKIIEWEELQQELARLCSLSSAHAKAKERKEFLSQQLRSVIEVRQKYLQQSNELYEMRQKLEARKLAMGEMAMQMRETKEDVKCKKEQLANSLRSLLVAGKRVCAAQEQLQANKLVIGKMGHGNAKSLQTMLRMRQQHMITQVNSLYPVKSSNEDASKEKFDKPCAGDEVQSSLPDMTRSPTLSSLTILGQQLTAFPLKKTSFFSDKKEIQKSSIVLGYVAHVVLLVASYLDVPLRYPLRLGGSRSHICDYAPSTETATSDLIVNPVVGANAKPAEFPLFLEGQDSTRAAYAIFLLNKDLEQLLNFFGAESLGPRNILANLKELMRIIQSPEFLDK